MTTESLCDLFKHAFLSVFTSYKVAISGALPTEATYPHPTMHGWIIAI